MGWVNGCAPLIHFRVAVSGMYSTVQYVSGMCSCLGHRKVCSNSEAPTWRAMLRVSSQPRTSSDSRNAVTAPPGPEDASLSVNVQLTSSRRGATAWPLMAPTARVVSPRLVIAPPILFEVGVKKGGRGGKGGGEGEGGQCT